MPYADIQKRAADIRCVRAKGIAQQYLPYDSSTLPSSPDDFTPKMFWDADVCIVWTATDGTVGAWIDVFPTLEAGQQHIAKGMQDLWALRMVVNLNTGERLV